MSSHLRYSNQLRVGGFSEEHQDILLGSHVLVVGAGGLGCPVLLQLAALGVGSISVVDDDVIAVHNLNRQTLFTPADVGAQKVQVAAQRIRVFNPLIKINAMPHRLTSKNAAELIYGKQLVLDCTDNIPARYAIDKACEELGVPMIFGGVRMLEGQFGVFNYKKGASFADVFPREQNLGQLEDCSTLGTFGFACQLIASYQVNEAFKVLLGKEHVESGCITSIDLETGTTFRVAHN